MFKFKMGLGMLAIITPMTIIFYFVLSGAFERVIWFLAFGLSETLALCVLISGVKKIMRDKKTELYGTETFGQIVRVSRTGSYDNGRPELKAEVVIYIPEDGKIAKFEEIIGFSPSKYRIGEFVLLKYLKGDINIIRSALEHEIPYNILQAIQTESYLEDSSIETLRKDKISVNDQIYVKENEDDSFYIKR